MQENTAEAGWQQLRERIDNLFGHLLKTDVQTIEDETRDAESPAGDTDCVS